MEKERESGKHCWDVGFIFTRSSVSLFMSPMINFIFVFAVLYELVVYSKCNCYGSEFRGLMINVIITDISVECR